MVYKRSAKLIIFLYDVSDEDSWSQLSTYDFQPYIKETIWGKLNKILLGTKSDLNVKVSEEDIQKWLSHPKTGESESNAHGWMNLGYVSSLSGEGFPDFIKHFNDVVRKILNSS